MIRNREAASLSRKKKKEYVTSLEEKVNILQKENLELKMVITVGCSVINFEKYLIFN